MEGLAMTHLSVILAILAVVIGVITLIIRFRDSILESVIMGVLFCFGKFLNWTETSKV